nr:MAG TPA: hypothetical protein [Caudoviricetes sp.]
MAPQLIIGSTAGGSIPPMPTASYGSNSNSFVPG